MNYDPKSLIGTPVDLASLTEYQPGSVVSRMVINKKAGTVTAFAFEAGEGLSEHTAPYDALVSGAPDNPVQDDAGNDSRIKEAISGLLLQKQYTNRKKIQQHLVYFARKTIITLF